METGNLRIQTNEGMKKRLLDFCGREGCYTMLPDDIVRFTQEQIKAATESKGAGGPPPAPEGMGRVPREALVAAVPWLFEYGAHQNTECYRGSDDGCLCGLDEAKKIVNDALAHPTSESGTDEAMQMLNRIRGTLKARAEGRNEGGDIEVMKYVDAIVKAESGTDAKLPIEIVDLLTNVAQLLDVIKGEWGDEWSAWDQEQRDAITKHLMSYHYPVKAESGRGEEMTQQEIIAGLKAGRKLRCDRKDNEHLNWLLGHPNINNKFVQADDQYSYIEFWWEPSTTLGNEEKEG